MALTMSNQPTNIHDAFFKQVLSDPALAAPFLREHLPPEIADLRGPGLPEPVLGSFVDEELRQHHSDLLFRIPLKSSHDAYAYVLMEHKSSPDAGARLQLLRYVVRILVQWYERNNRQLPLPPVLPLLAHQGPEGWTSSCEFADLFGNVPDPLRPYIPSFRHALVDLAPMDDLTLSIEVRLRAFLKALKYSRRGDLLDCIAIVLAEAPELNERDLFVILTYLNKAPVARNYQVMHETLEHLVPDRAERIMGWFTDDFYEKGLAEGEARGEVRGKTQGEAKILTRLLERRFGALPDPIRHSISSADPERIEAWVERAFDAPPRQSVFAPN
jgi:predicted transposase/invertase (TIGR01784 family)